MFIQQKEFKEERCQEEKEDEQQTMPTTGKQATKLCREEDQKMFPTTKTGK